MRPSRPWQSSVNLSLGDHCLVVTECASSYMAGLGESRGGISPPRAPKTVRESLDSHGFRCSAADIKEPPMGEERWIGAANPDQPFSCALRPPAQALELPTRPADQVGVDTHQRWS